MSWVQLLGQRKRWINGTIATYVYYLMDEEGKLELAISELKSKMSIELAWGMQLYQSAVTILSPGFFCIALYEGMKANLSYIPAVARHFRLWGFMNIPLLVSCGYYCVYLLWVINAILMGTKPSFLSKLTYERIMEPIYTLFAFVNFILSACVVFFILNSPLTFGAGMFNPMIVFVLMVWAVPFFLALTLSPSSAFLYLIYGIPYLLQLSQYVSLLPAFAFARMNDLSWGNRDVELSHDAELIEIEKERKSAEFLKLTLRANLISTLANLVVFLGYITITSNYQTGNYLSIPVTMLVFGPLMIQSLFAALFIGSIFLKYIKRKTRSGYRSFLAASRATWRGIKDSWHGTNESPEVAAPDNDEDEDILESKSVGSKNSRLKKNSPVLRVQQKVNIKETKVPSMAGNAPSGKSTPIRSVQTSDGTETANSERQEATPPTSSSNGIRQRHTGFTHSASHLQVSTIHPSTPKDK